MDTRELVQKTKNVIAQQDVQEAAWKRLQDSQDKFLEKLIQGQIDAKQIEESMYTAYRAMID